MQLRNTIFILRIFLVTRMSAAFVAFWNRCRQIVAGRSSMLTLRLQHSATLHKN